MDVYQNRLASFSPQKRGKNVKKWPHPLTFTATPTTLAEAGFYFCPSASDPDNVACFMCDKQLSSWESTDDPFEIHFQKCQVYCSWAVLRCGMSLDMLPDGSFKITDKARLPYSKTMEKARLETFTSGTPWDHDRVRGHGASSKNMTKAGFVHTPQPEDPDCATCLYCKTCLSGWDADDDPLEEHRKRVEKHGLQCPFFAAKPTKPTKSKHVDEIMPIKTHDGPVDEVEPPEGSTAKTPRKGRSTAVKKGAKTPSTRSRRNQSQTEDDDETDSAAPPRSTRRKTTHSRSRSLVSGDDEDEILPMKTPKSKGKSKRVVETDEESDVPLNQPKSSHSRTRSQSTMPAEDTAPIKTPAPRTVSRTRTKSKVVDDSDASPPLTVKPKSRAKSSKNPGTEDAPTTSAPKTVRKASRTVSKSRPPASQRKASQSESEDAEMDQYLPPPTVKSKTTEHNDDEKEGTPTPAPLPKPKAGLQQARKPSQQISRTVSASQPSPSEPESDPVPPTKKPNPNSQPKPPHDKEHGLFPFPTQGTKRSSAQSTMRVSQPLSKSSHQHLQDVDIEQDDDIDVPFVSFKVDAEKARPRVVSQSSSSRKLSRTVSRRDDMEIETALLDSTMKAGSSADAQRGRKTSTQSVKRSQLDSWNCGEPQECTTSKIAASNLQEKTKTKGKPLSQGKSAKDLRLPVADPDDDVFYDALSPTTAELPSDSGSQSQNQVRHASPSNLGATTSPPSTREVTIANPSSDIDNDEEERELELKLVQISSDEEEVAPAVRKGKGKAGKAQNPAVVEEDVEMLEENDITRSLVEMDSDAEMPPIIEPRTPPRRPVSPVVALPSLPKTSRPIDHEEDGDGDTTAFPFIPPLSQEPFVNIDILSEDELAMTVEEWIQYQTQIGYDKFRKDGERELEAFAQRAEEVRIAIEAL